MHVYIKTIECSIDEGSENEEYAEDSAREERYIYKEVRVLNC